METRLLFLDDSGKPDQRHSSAAVVIAGFAIDADVYPNFARRVLGAKKRYFPNRGLPHLWEIKSTDVVKPNPWKRKKNRAFAAEVCRLLAAHQTTCFSVTLDKRKMNHQMSLSTTMPLQLQALSEHFDAECRVMRRTGMIIADWSAQHSDAHANQCVVSFVRTQHLQIHPGVYYASSSGNEAIQVCDLIAGIRRRTAEGDRNLAILDNDLAAIQAREILDQTTRHRSFTNRIALFGP